MDDLQRLQLAGEALGIDLRAGLGQAEDERLRELMRVRAGFGSRGGLEGQWRRSLMAADPLAPENQGQPPEAHFNA